jgi:uncharacterized membrane protein
MILIIISLVALVITLPLFLADGLIASYDIFFHAVWSEQFNKALTDGVLYPQWVDTPFGYGSPTFIFYAPLSFYLIGLINSFSTSHILSMKIAIYLSFFLSGITMYIFARKLNGDRAGLISAMVYQLLPYHISELFLRGSIPALVAFIWFPLILLFIREIFIGEKNTSIIYMGFAYAGLITTHLASSFIFTFIMVGYSLYLSIFEKKSGISKMAFGIVLGFGLSSAYLLPVIFERVFIHIDVMKSFYFGNNFLLMGKNLIQEPLNRIFFADILFLLISVILLRNNFFTGGNSFYIYLQGIALFLTVPASGIIWQNIPGFSALQFPWRWLFASGLSIAVISGSMVSKPGGDIKKALAAVIVSTLILSLFTIAKPFSLADIDFWRSQSVAFSPFEYRPIWVKNPRKELPAVERVRIVKGGGKVDIVEWKSNHHILSVSGKGPIGLQLSTFYFPGWKAKKDGQHIDIMVMEESGSMAIEIPEGTHKLELIFEDTCVRRSGKIISLITLFFIVSVLLVRLRKIICERIIIIL